jgi:hypothetical protein
VITAGRFWVFTEEQISTRKQSIESELARIEGLRGEHEAVTAQVAALDQAMKAFQDREQ